MPKPRNLKNIPNTERRCMVWHEGGSIPTVAHGNFNAAFGEANRLARANPGERFHLLQTRRVIVCEADQ